MEAADALKTAGIEEVMVFCVNDGAVMSAWSKDQKTEGSIVRMYGDPHSEFTRAIDMELTHKGPKSVGLINRCKRLVLVVDDGEVKFAE